MSKTNKGSRSNTATIAIIALMLAAVIVTGVITHGFKDWDACACFGHKYNAEGICTRCGEEKPEEDKPTGDINMLITPNESRFIMLSTTPLMASPQAAEHCVVTATLNPEYPLDDTINWALAWNDNTSTWANGKNVLNYVNITPSENTHSVTVECLQAFGEQVFLTATANSNEKAMANCTIDYLKKATSIANFSIEDGLAFDRELHCNYDVNYSDYTIDTQTKYKINWIDLDAGFVDTPYANKLYEMDDRESWDSYTLPEIFKTGSLNINFNFDNVNQIITFDGTTFARAAMIDDVGYEFFDNAMAMCLQDGCDNIFGINVTVSTIYNGEVVSNVTKTFHPALDKDSFIIVAESIKLSQGSIKF